MTDKELIKQEIERLDEKYRTLRVEGTTQQAKEADLVVHALLQISNFIDSLQEPASENLEEEINHISKNEYFNFSDWKSIARHFAEWQKEQDYKIYAHVPLKDIHDTWQELKKNKPDIENYPAVCFQKGADWRENHMKESLQVEYEKGRFDMREEMMKDAVEAFVNTYENSDDSNYVEFVTEQSPYKFKETEKCKLIIIKEEQ